MTSQRLDPPRQTTRPARVVGLAGAVSLAVLCGGLSFNPAHAQSLPTAPQPQIQAPAEPAVATDAAPTASPFPWRQPGEALNHIGTSLRGLWARVQGRVHIVVDQPSAPQLADLESEHADHPSRSRGGLSLTHDGDEGGFRAMAGLVRGEPSNWWVSHSDHTTGLNPSFQRLNAAGLLSGSGLRATDPTFVGTRPYLGAAYSTRLANRGTPGLWRFNADLGLMSLQDSKTGPLGQAFSGERGLDELFHDLRLRPNVKVSVGYSF
jgi:hypothetical protein